MICSARLMQDRDERAIRTQLLFIQYLTVLRIISTLERIWASVVEPQSS